MGLILRQSFKGAIAQYLGIVLGYVNLIILFPLCLSLEQNGVTRFILEMGAIVAMFAQLGIPNSLPRFYVRFKKLTAGVKHLNALILSLFLIGLVLSFLFMYFNESVIVSSFKNDSQLVSQYYWFIYIISISIVLLNILEQYSIVNFRMTAPKIVREIGLRLLVGSLLVCYYFEIVNFLEFLQYIVLGQFALLITLAIYVNSLARFKFKFSKELFKVSLSKDFYWFILLIIIAGIGTNVVMKIDFYMVSSLIDVSSLAVYGTAAYIVVFMEVPVRLINQISSPIISEHMISGKMDSILDLYKKSSINQLVIGSTLFLLLYYNIGNVIELMPSGKDFSGVANLVLYLGIGKLFILTFGTTSIILSNSKYYYIGLFFVLFLAGLTIFTNVIFIKSMGLDGVGVATAISSGIYFIILALFVYFKFKMHPITRKTLIILCLTGINIVLYHTIPMPENVYFNILAVTALGLLNLIVAMKLNLSDEINETVVNYWNKLRNTNR